MEPQIKTAKAWLKNVLTQVKEADKKSDFYMRITGKVVGTCPMTVGYIGKSEFMGKFTYYACHQLYSYMYSWQHHCVYAREFNKVNESKAASNIMGKPEYKILITTSLVKALKFLKLEDHK